MKGGIIINGISRGETVVGPQSCLCPELGRNFKNTRLHVSVNRRKCCKNKCRTPQPLFSCMHSTLFIQNSIIREEWQTVCSAALQTHHNQSKISNHLKRLHLFFFSWTEIYSLLSASFSLPLLLVTFPSRANPSSACREV